MILKNTILTKTLIAALGIGGLTAATAKADWHDRDDHRDDRWRHDDDRRDWHRDHDRDHGGWDLHIGDIFAPPVETAATQRIWVEPVYRTVTDRVWVDPVYRTDTTRVWVAPVVELRERVGWEHGRRVIYRENVEVAPGHYEDRTQQCTVTEGHWQNVDRTEVVAPGHWEDRVVAVTAPPPSGVGFNLNIHGH